MPIFKIKKRRKAAVKKRQMRRQAVDKGYFSPRRGEKYFKQSLEK